MDRNGVSPRGCWQRTDDSRFLHGPKAGEDRNLGPGGHAVAPVALGAENRHPGKKIVHCCGLKVKLESFFSLEGENITSREEQKIFYCIITLAF